MSFVGKRLMFFQPFNRLIGRTRCCVISIDSAYTRIGPCEMRTRKLHEHVGISSEQPERIWSHTWRTQGLIFEKRRSVRMKDLFLLSNGSKPRSHVEKREWMSCIKCVRRLNGRLSLPWSHMFFSRFGNKSCFILKGKKKDIFDGWWTSCIRQF